MKVHNNVLEREKNGGGVGLRDGFLNQYIDLEGGQGIKDSTIALTDAEH